MPSPTLKHYEIRSQRFGWCATGWRPWQAIDALMSVLGMEVHVDAKYELAGPEQ
jgi:hypothetical protein